MSARLGVFSPIFLFLREQIKTAISQQFMVRDEQLKSDLCAISDEVKTKMKKFRFRKATDNAAVVLKIDINKMEVFIFQPGDIKFFKLLVEEEFDDIEKLDDLIDELPELQPRFLVYSCR